MLIILIIRQVRLQLQRFTKNSSLGLKKYEVGVVSDFAYGALGADGYENPSFLSTPGAKDVGIELYTFLRPLIWRVAFGICGRK